MIRTLDESKWVKIGELEFQLRFIPRREWRKISAGFSSMDLGNLENQSQDEKVSQSLKLVDYYCELIRFGVCGHKGLIANGKEIEFKLVDNKLPDELIDLYDLNGLTIQLGSEIVAFNALTDDSKKN